MVTGWRRAFCTSIPKERETQTPPVLSTDKPQQQHCTDTHSPRISSKFGFFSNPSTPRLQSQPVSTSSLRCKTTVAAAATTPPTSSLPNSPKLKCKTPTTKSNSPRLFQFSNPSSPKSPSSFSLLKATLRLPKSRCGICLQSVRTGHGTAIFTAECNHVFHFPCVASHVKKQNLLVCPVCNTSWKEIPLLSTNPIATSELIKHEDTATKVGDLKPKSLRVYNDDEPLMSPSPGSLFNPIPESEENDENESHEFQGFFVNNPPTSPSFKLGRNVDVSLLPESAVVAVGRNYETHVVVMKVRAPAAARGLGRPPIDLVAVLEVSDKMCGVKSQMMKRAMRLVISTLSSTDRLSIVAFSNNSKRLSPLRRMTANGRRSARRIVEALGNTGQGMSVNDALKKAAKVMEDRREKNPAASILILSDGPDDRSHITAVSKKRPPLVISSTRFSQLDIPVHTIGFGEMSAYRNAPTEDAILKLLGGLLNITAQEVKIQVGFVSGSAPAEIAAVYSLSGRPSVHGPGSIRLGDFHAEEEKEVLVEIKVPLPASSLWGAHHMLSVRSSFKEPSSLELIIPTKEVALLVPRAQPVRSSAPTIQRLRSLHISTRAVAESRRLVEHGDLSGSYHLLSSARALLMQSKDGSAVEYIRGLEAELAEVQRRRQQVVVQRQRQRQSSGQQVEEKPEPLTPTSAWRAAERLAKVAIMRKHMNRVSDLHGFENARF